MKRILVPLMAIILLGIFFTNAKAGNRSVNGLLLGGGTGAIVGQAIGHNTESTIIGATVGGVVGFVIGSEMDRHRTTVHHYSQPAYSHQRSNYYRERPHYRERPRVVRQEFYYYNNGNPGYRHGYKKKRHPYNSRRVFSNGPRHERRHYKKQNKRHRRHGGSYR
jgi:hypothetical protein